MPAGRLSPAAASRYIAEHWHVEIHPETIRRWARKGHLRSTRTPAGYILIDPSDIDAAFSPTSSKMHGND